MARPIKWTNHSCLYEHDDCANDAHTADGWCWERKRRMSSVERPMSEVSGKLGDGWGGDKHYEEAILTLRRFAELCYANRMKRLAGAHVTVAAARAELTALHELVVGEFDKAYTIVGNSVEFRETTDIWYDEEMP